MKNITPTLLFIGTGEEAIAFYLSIFKGADICHMKKYGPEEPDMEGKIMQAKIAIGNLELLIQDSPPIHDFTFTPSVSFTIEVESLEEFQQIFDGLGADGQVLMPPDHYGFSSRFAWINDRFGVSWQINLA